MKRTIKPCTFLTSKLSADKFTVILQYTKLQYLIDLFAWAWSLTCALLSNRHYQPQNSLLYLTYKQIAYCCFLFVFLNDCTILIQKEVNGWWTLPCNNPMLKILNFKSALQISYIYLCSRSGFTLCCTDW